MLKSSLKSLTYLLPILSINFTYAALENASILKITQVKTATDPKNTQNFDTYITFHTKDKTFERWSFGFYMPRTFNALSVEKTGTNINPDLRMKICSTTDNKICARLKYVKQNNMINQLSYGDGFSNVFTPSTPFPLKANTQYKIKLLNNNQWAPANINAMPQSFFISDKDKQHIYPVTTNMSAYGASNNFKAIGGYDYNQVNQEIKHHIQKNWQNSQSLNTNEFVNQLGIIPSPRIIQNLDMHQFIDIHKHPFNLIANNTFDRKDLKGLLKFLPVNLSTTRFAYDFLIQYTPKIANPEGYELNVDRNKIIIKAQTITGVFYAIQTLRQLDYLHHGQIPLFTIRDKPTFKYRGLLIDVSRHFFTIKELKKIINAMSALKLNSLHIHFSDDEAWRLELPSVTGKMIKKASSRGYIKGSRNPAAMYLQANQDLTNYKDFDPSKPMIKPQFANATTRYKGYYTQKQINNLINYANKRQITIIPEIDLPGHARALVHSACDIFMNPLDHSRYISVQGYYNDVIPVCLYNQATSQSKRFTQKINAIISDIAKLFSNQTTLYAQDEVSVGGDEVSKDAWSNDASCHESLTALDRSHQFFNSLYTANPNIKLSGWQQFVQSDHGDIGQLSLAPKHTAHTWVWDPSTVGLEHAQILARHHYPTVLAYSDHLYFDLTYTPNAWEPGLYWAGTFLDTHAALTSAVKAKQTLAGLSQQYQEMILGLEGALWSENITTNRHLEYQAFPKITGLSEASWSPMARTTKNNQANWKSLAYRLGNDSHTGVLEYLNHTYNIVYRGMPNGIAKEIPTDEHFDAKKAYPTKV